MLGTVLTGNARMTRGDLVSIFKEFKRFRPIKTVLTLVCKGYSEMTNFKGRQGKGTME